MREDVGTNDAAQRHEGYGLLGCLERGMKRRTRRILDSYAAVGDACGKARRRPQVTKADPRGFDRFHAPSADEQIRLERGRRQGHEAEPLDSSANQTSGRLHRHAPVVGRNDEQAAVRDRRKSIVQLPNLSLRGGGVHRADSTITDAVAIQTVLAGRCPF